MGAADLEERRYYEQQQRVFRVLAPVYDAIALPIRRLRHHVAALVGAGPGSRVLDVATGTGAQAAAFAEQGAEVVGLDLSEAMLQVARRKHDRPNLRFVRGDATCLPFEDASFDVVSISFALHEMPAAVRERAVREIARVTRPGGRVVVVDYALPEGTIARGLVFRFVRLYERDHYADFVHEDLRGLLRAHGIDPEQPRPALLGAVTVVLGTRASRPR